MASTIFNLQKFSVSETLLSQKMFQAVLKTKSWTQLQVAHECCGVHNYTDWLNDSLWMFRGTKVSKTDFVPDSCCVQYIADCGKNTSDASIFYQQGCLESVAVHVNRLVQAGTTNWQIKCIALLMICIFLTFIASCILVTHTFPFLPFLKAKTKRYVEEAGKLLTHAQAKSDVKGEVVPLVDVGGHHANEHGVAHTNAVCNENDSDEYCDETVSLLKNDTCARQEANDTIAVIHHPSEEHSDADSVIDLR